MKLKIILTIVMLLSMLLSTSILVSTISAQETPLYNIRTSNAINKNTEITTNNELETKTELNIPTFEEHYKTRSFATHWTIPDMCGDCEPSIDYHSLTCFFFICFIRNLFTIDSYFDCYLPSIILKCGRTSDINMVTCQKPICNIGK